MAETKDEGLRAELEQLRHRVQAQRQAFRQVRGAIGAMRGSRDVEPLLKAVWEALSILGMSFKYCGVNIIDESVDPPKIIVHNMTPEGELRSYEYQEAREFSLMRI
jgi:hypothetical protein